MNIGQLTKLNITSLLAAGTQAAAKLPIPKSSRQINADSLKWLDKLGSSIGRHITSSIESGKLFELAFLGANIFGTPVFSEHGETHRPVLHFEPGHDQDLNLASIDMQTPAGELHPWASAPSATAPATPPASPNRIQAEGTPPLLPQRPRTGSTLTTIGVALSNLHQAKINNHSVVGTPPPLPPRHSSVPQDGGATVLPPSPLPISQRPPTPPTASPISTQHTKAEAYPQPGKSTAQDLAGTPLDDIERFLVGPSFSERAGASPAQSNTQRRAFEPSTAPQPKPITQAQRAASFPANQNQQAPARPAPSPVRETAMDIPDLLRPGLGRRTQSNPVNRNFSAAPMPVSSDVPDSLRPGPARRRASEPTNAIEARSRLASATAQRPTLVQTSGAAPVRFTNLQPMQQIYKGEETGQVFGTSVKYLNERERAAFKVTIKDGKVYDATGKLFDTRGASTAFKHNKGRAIFVMDATGAMYISNEQTRGKFHHSSFFGGKPVAAAGDIRIENGMITIISRNSGHYRPSLAQLNQAINHLKSQGISGVFVDEDLS